MQRFSSLPNAKAHGFTLLEVMVALTITALALGALFSVIGGNKRLAWRAEDVLVQSMQVRSMINVAQLNDEQGEVLLGEQQREFKLVSGEEIERPIARQPALWTISAIFILKTTTAKRWYMVPTGYDSSR